MGISCYSILDDFCNGFICIPLADVQKTDDVLSVVNTNRDAASFESEYER